MAVRIRLRRMGRKGRPFYRVVVADSRHKRDGRFIEILGHYNPMVDPIEEKINEERTLYWLSVGAQPSNTAKRILHRAGIMEKFHNSRPRKK